MPLATRSRYRRTSLTWPEAMTIVPGSQTSARALMSFSGSADSERSTNRMFGLAETESDCTALRSPPLLTFSGDQPCSTATGRSMSAVASSQARAWNGAFILFALLCRNVLQSLVAGRLRGLVDAHGLGAGRDVGDAVATLAVNQILGIGDHRREVRVHCAAEVRHHPVVVVRLRLPLPIRAVRNARHITTDDHADVARSDGTGSYRGTLRNEHAVVRRNAGDLRARTLGIGPTVDVDAVAVAQVEAAEPAIEASCFGRSERPAGRSCIERIVRAADDRNVHRRHAGLEVRAR